MKVLHVIPSVSPLHGGPSFAVRRMAEAVASLDVEVDVATTTANGKEELRVPLGRAVIEQGVRYFYFPRQHPTSWTFSWPLTRWLAQHAGAYDVVHAHALFSYPPLAACWAARRKGVPYVLRPLGTLDPWALRFRRWKKTPYLWLFERRNLRGAAAVQAVSQREQCAIEALGLGARAVTIALGVDLPAVEDLEGLDRKGRTVDGAVNVLSLSRLHAKKGIELLLDAVSLVDQTHAMRLVVAGGGDTGYVNQLKKRAAANGLAERVSFTGFVAGAEKWRLLGQADLFVLSSYDENFGMAVVEALSAGLPVVVSDQVALAGQIEEAGAGIVAPCDAGQMARAIEKVIADHGLRRRMGDAGRRLAETQFSWSEVGRRLKALYEEIGRAPVRHHPVASDRRALSVIVLTYNEEANLPACLASLNGLDCEVFVVDSGSTDRTLEIAKAAGAHVAEHSFEHYAAQRNWAQANLPVQSEWMLHLDADERLTPDLVKEINEVMADPAPDVDGFLLRKRTFFMGRWIRHGGHYPSYHLRLLRRDRGHCEDRLYDQHFIVSGRVARLRHDYVDVVASDLSTWTRRHIRWAELEAREMLSVNQGPHRVQPRLFGTAIERRRWLRERLFWRSPLFVRAFGYWVYRYVFRLGFLDGVEGLIFHFLQGCWYRLLVDAHIYEARRRARAKP